MMHKQLNLRAVIIDDERDAVEILRSLIHECFSDIEIVGEALSVEEGIQLIERLQPDILFLDIQMPKGSGFEVLKNTKNNFHTVFVSAHESYALEAIKFHAMAYLLKPVGKEDLIEAIDALKEKLRKKEKESYELLINSLDPENQSRIAIPIGSGYLYFKPKEIIRVEASKNYSNVYTIKSEKPILVSKNLKTFEVLLEKYQFLRVHNTHLVNPDHVAGYMRQYGGSLIISDGTDIQIGRHYKQLVLDYFEQRSDFL